MRKLLALLLLAGCASPEVGKPEAPVKSFVAPRYADPKLTDQSIEVKAGGSPKVQLTVSADGTTQVCC